ncbi:TetR family transcriptional regulator, partial [Acinetobacter baumannii]
MSKRDTIIKTATALFNEKSYNSIGVDRIIAESNVA